MNFSIVLSSRMQVDKWLAASVSGTCPRHASIDVGMSLKAQFHVPTGDDVQFLDRVCSVLLGRAEHWSTARRVARAAATEDVIFCSGDDVGVPLAIYCKFLKKSPRISFYYISPAGKRIRYLIKALSLQRFIHLYLVDAPGDKLAHLQRNLSVDAKHAIEFRVPIDEEFFSPYPAPPLASAKPIVASGGMEKRDYFTLAKAVSGLPIEVRISAASNGARDRNLARTLPKHLPENVSARPYELLELRDLYRSAAIVVVPLLPNQQSAGTTTILEGMASRRPVVVTRMPGLPSHLIDAGAVIGVEPGDAAGLRAAIERLLADPLYAEHMADQGHRYFLEHHTHSQYVEALASALRRLAPRLAEHSRTRSPLNESNSCPIAARRL
jgi:glycosyltransferase involved in cell wall biosynthesis